MGQQVGHEGWRKEDEKERNEKTGGRGRKEIGRGSWKKGANTRKAQRIGSREEKKEIDETVDDRNCERQKMGRKKKRRRSGSGEREGREREGQK